MSKTKNNSIYMSETVLIHRSEIKFAPYNPKNHSSAAVDIQRRNFKDKGFLGGIVWNKTSGNLISGHRRIMAFDVIYAYDGTLETDYEVKVEMVEFTDKQEKEQNIFMDARSANTPQDLKMIGDFISEIDYKSAGLSDMDMNAIAAISPIFDTAQPVEEIVADYSLNDKSKEQRKAEIKQLKKDISDKVDKGYDESLFLVFTFKTFENKAYLCELLKLDQYQKYGNGELLLEQLELKHS